MKGRGSKLGGLSDLFAFECIYKVFGFYGCGYDNSLELIHKNEFETTWNLNSSVVKGSDKLLLIYISL